MLRISLMLVISSACAVFSAEYPQLAEIPVDTVWLNGGRPLHGMIQETRQDGSVVIQAEGFLQTIPRNRYERIEARVLAAEVVTRRSAALLADRNWDEIQRTVAWGMSKGVKDEVLALALKALAVNPNQIDLATQTLALLAEKNDLVQSEQILRASIKVDSHWREGRKQLTKLLRDAKRDDDLYAAVRDWIQSSPTDQEPLRMLASLEEARGNIRAAQDAWRRAWESQKDGIAGVAYARLLLRHGEIPKALDVASALAGQDATARPGKAIAGSAQLILGKNTEAESLLRDAIAGELESDLAFIAKYNLALVCLRTGKRDEARTLWAALEQPQAHYAMAVLDRTPLGEADIIPALGTAPALHNAMLQLERNPAGPLPEGFPAQSGRQAQFVQAIARVFAEGATVDGVRSLATFPGPVSIRWQAYGHLVAKRYDEALLLLDQLPPEDGYALAYRVHIALERKDMTKATELWQRLQTAPTAPRDWMARIALIFDAASHDNLIEKFDLESETPPTGWVYQAPGTGIRMRQFGGKLWFEGTQRKATDSVSRAWRLVKQESIRRVVAAFDVTGVNGATAGLELLDNQRRNGVSFAIQPDRSLAWRERRNATWGEWKALTLKLTDGQNSIGLDYSGGQAKGFVLDAPDKAERLGDWDGRAQSELCVAVFGTAPDGTAWKLGVDEVRIELNSRAKRTGDD